MKSKIKTTKIASLLLISFMSINIAFVQPAHANALDDISETVSSYWDSFTNWLTGGSGSSSESSSEEGSDSDYSESSSDDSSASVGSSEDASNMVQLINSNNGVLPSNAHIKAKKKQPDGTWKVVISSSNESRKENIDIVLTLGESGLFSTLDLSDDESMQKEYEAIMAGNEMTAEEVEKTDSVMHDISAMSKILKEEYGLSAKTLAATATGAAALGGLYLAGVGVTGKKKEEIEEAVSKSMGKRSSSSYKITPVDMNAIHNSLANMPNTANVCDKAMYHAVSNCIASTTDIWQGESLEKLASYIITTANKYGLNPMVVTAQLKQESGFNPTAGSSAGAQGIAQFIPETAASFGINPWSVTEAIDGQCRYMSDLMKNFGDYTLALAGYNAGGGAVSQYGGVPPYPETRCYVSSISDIIGRMTNEYDKVMS